MVTVDQLLGRIQEFQHDCRHAVQSHRWGDFRRIRAEFRTWCEVYLPGAVEFPPEDD